MYTLANASVKIANKKFTSIKNDYCLTLSDQTVITEVLEDAKITQSGFSFTGLREIEDIVDTCTLDVIGVIMDVQPTVSIMTKSGLSKEKLSFIIADESNNSIGLTLWSEACECEYFQAG